MKLQRKKDNLMPDDNTKDKGIELAEYVEMIVPYVLATIRNPIIGDRSEWIKIHAGRACSSVNQLENLRAKAREMLEETKKKRI